MYERILVTLDGSKLAERAIPYAEMIAKTMGSRIMLLSAHDKREGIEHPLESYLYDVADKLHKSGLEATAHLANGNAADQIIDFTEKTGIDLVIMCTHGNTGVSRWSFGGVSNKVMHELYCPLLLIKTGACALPSMMDGPLSILTPLDGSEISEEALHHTAALAQGKDSSVVLLRVDETTNSAVITNASTKANSTASRGKISSRRQSNIHSYLGTVRDKKLHLDSRKVICEVMYGRPAEEIIRYAELHDISMIVITTHGRSQYSQWAFGSVANKVVQGTSKPTLIVRSKPTILNLC